MDLCYGALRSYGRGDFFLSRLLHKPLADAQVHALLLAALYRLESRPEEVHTGVDQAVLAASALAGGAFKSLANAVLRNWLRRRDELRGQAESDELAHWQHPRWWIDRIRSAYPAQWPGILAAGNVHPPMSLRVNLRKNDVASYAKRLTEGGIAATPCGGAGLRLQRPVPVERLPGFAEGLASVQDLGAQQAADILDPSDGMRVLDACAAPGGKACHILERNDVELTALDADEARLAKLRQNLRRNGLRAGLRSADCRDIALWWDGQPFDRILADVPCSGSGIARRHPDIKWLRRETDLAQFAATQASILEALWHVLAPGGKLLYATCSVFPSENDEQIAAFASRREDCGSVQIGCAVQRLILPCSEHDGFYYALLEKRA
jgi:16S rRNA (cytosine967-C5)-methyltransferase